MPENRSYLPPEEPPRWGERTQEVRELDTDPGFRMIAEPGGKISEVITQNKRLVFDEAQLGLTAPNILEASLALKDAIRNLHARYSIEMQKLAQEETQAKKNWLTKFLWNRKYYKPGKSSNYNYETHQIVYYENVNWINLSKLNAFLRSGEQMIARKLHDKSMIDKQTSEALMGSVATLTEIMNDVEQIIGMIKKSIRSF